MSDLEIIKLIEQKLTEAYGLCLVYSEGETKLSKLVEKALDEAHTTKLVLQ